MRRILMILVGLSLAAASCGGAVRDDAGAIVEEGTLGLFAVQEGDCVNVTDDDEVGGFDGVACDQPHNAQAYAVYDVVEFTDDFPGNEAIAQSAEDGCLSRFDAFVGIAYADSIYYSSHVFPSLETWETGDREVVCLLVPELEGDTFSTDLRGAAA